MAVPIVWLPLNGSLINNGIDNSAKITCENAKYVDGKIGKCINIEKYQSDTASFSMLNNISQFSFSCWLYIDAGKTFTNYHSFFRIGFIADGFDSNIRIEHTNSAGAFQVIFNKSATSGSNATNYYYVGGSSVDARDKWCHITVTNDGANVKTYINGSLSITTPVSSIYATGMLNGTFILGSSGSSVRLNDLRIYDEALTPRQISLISQCLVMHYPLDHDWSTSVVYDCSGYGHDGTVNGALTYQNDSLAGNGCIYFNGSTNIKVKAVNWDTGYQVSQFTLTQWCKVKAGWSTSSGIHGLSWGNDFIRLVLGKSNFIWSYVKCINSMGTTGNKSLSYGVASEIVEDRWYFIALTFDNGVMKLYLDGALVATADHSSEFPALYYGTPNTYIGSYSSSGELGIGCLSDVRAYASALSETHIMDLYQAKIAADNNGNIYCYGIHKKDGIQFWNTGIVTCCKWCEEEGSGGQIIEI